jgi:hypothetical protein
MEGFSVVLLENLFFWSLVIYIAIYKKQTPNWFFSILTLYLLYFVLRFMFSKKGMEFGVLWYTANMIVLFSIIYMFAFKN